LFLLSKLHDVDLFLGDLFHLILVQLLSIGNLLIGCPENVRHILSPTHLHCDLFLECLHWL